MTINENNTYYSEPITRALINRIASPYRHNKEGASAAHQTRNMYDHSAKEAKLILKADHDAAETEVKLFCSSDANVAGDEYREFVVKQISNPLALGLKLGHGFDRNVPYEDSFLATFLRTLGNLGNEHTGLNIFATDVTIELSKKSAHGMFIEVSKKNDGNYIIKFYNTGYGNHHHAPSKRCKSHAITYTLTENQLFDIDRKEKIRDLMQFLRIDSRSNHKLSSSKVMDEFYLKLDTAFGVQSPNNPEKIINRSRGKDYRDQTGSDCSAKCSSVWAHAKFKEGAETGKIKESDYYTFKIGKLMRHKDQLLSERTHLKGTKMKVFFKCFRFLNNFYIRLEKGGHWFLSWIIHTFFMHYTKNEQRLKSELTRAIDRKITICQEKKRLLVIRESGCAAA